MVRPNKRFAEASNTGKEIENLQTELNCLKNYNRSQCKKCVNCFASFKHDSDDYNLLCLVTKQNLKADVERYEDEGEIKFKTVYLLPVLCCSHFQAR